MFDNRLSILREESGMSKKDVAVALKIPYTTYLNYENDIREPNSDTLIKIAKLYGVSIDYLLGMSDVITTDIDLKARKRKMKPTNKIIFPEKLNVGNQLDNFVGTLLDLGLTITMRMNSCEDTVIEIFEKESGGSDE